MAMKPTVASPPRTALFSMSSTLHPLRGAASVALTPAMPPPTTITSYALATEP